MKRRVITAPSAGKLYLEDLEVVEDLQCDGCGVGLVLHAWRSGSRARRRPPLQIVCQVSPGVEVRFEVDLCPECEITTTAARLLERRRSRS